MEVTDPIEMLAVLALRRGKGGWSVLAKEIGVSRSYLSQVKNRNREPGERVLAFLGLRREKVTRLVPLEAAPQQH
jgi:transcriptional regulator with XRE-family HTH domain